MLDMTSAGRSKSVVVTASQSSVALAPLHPVLPCLPLLLREASSAREGRNDSAVTLSTLGVIVPA